MTVSTNRVRRSISPARQGRLVRVLAALTIVGFVVPNTMLVLHVVESGASPGGYFGLWVDSLPGAQLFADLVICSLAFFAWSAIDARRLDVRWGAVVPATFLVGLCFSLPLYLYLRERRIAALMADEARRG